jgi:thiol-disulfide isomerase/thioredoxin
MLDKNRFESGLSFPDFLNSVSTRKEEWLNNYQEFELTEAEIKKLSAVQKKFKVLALTEDWCGDCVRNLPVIARLVEALSESQLKVFTRDDNLDLMQKFTPDDKMRIPTVVFMDQDFKVLALWIEEPANGPILKEKFLSQPDGKEKYLSALQEEVKKEIFSLLDEIKDR